MKRISIGLCTFFLLAYAQCLHAQGIVSPVELTVAQQMLKRGPVSILSKTNNQLLQEQLSAFFQPPVLSVQSAKAYLPPSEKPITFRVQKTSSSQVTASAFAIEVDGHLFGVTAGHVMNNISQQPYMYFQKKEGTFVAEKITSWRSTNSNGPDVAVFEIPHAAREYVQVLSPAAQRARAQEIASIAGFSWNEPLWLPEQEILFANSHRLFLRRYFPSQVDGLCGSPVMVGGKVVGLYVGGYVTGVPSVLGWPKLFKSISSQAIPPLHLASPIENIFPLIDDLLGKTEQPAGQPLKVLGIPVVTLQPADRLFSVGVIRDDKLIQNTFAGDLTDPEHLEQFLELEENDIVRITIFHDKPQADNFVISRHGINVTTKQILDM